MERGGQVWWHFNANNNRRKQELGTKKTTDKHAHTNYVVFLGSSLSALSLFETNPAYDIFETVNTPLCLCLEGKVFNFSVCMCQ